jgi:hypothetical protein
MAGVQLPQVLTANRLATGDVVYWRRGDWVEDIGDAELLAGREVDEAALALAQQSVVSRAVVNPYLFAVRQDGDGIHPFEEREIIRAAGPSVRRDLGKQSHHAGAPHV